MPWFPTQISDLDLIGKKLLQKGSGITDVDHPGFRDPEYMDRRELIAQISSSYSMADEELPRVEYTETENKVWNYCYTRLTKMHEVHACREYNEIIADFKKHIGYSEDVIP